MLGSPLPADVLTLTPAADTTIAEIAADNNYGGAGFFNAGTSRNGHSSRGLLRFDVASALPSSAEIIGVSLVLDAVREPSQDPEASAFGLHRVWVPWGEGDKVPSPSGPGLGEPATAGEATWNDRFAFTSKTWSVPGGAAGVDYAAPAASELFVYGVADSPYTFASTPALVADVQDWLNRPEANFGWMLLSESEGLPATARSFGSRTSIGPPQLEVEFVIVPEPGTGVLMGLAVVVVVAGRARRIARRLTRSR